MLEILQSAKFVGFTHIVNSANKALVESHCVGCGSWIATGPREKYLEIAESAHNCSADGVSI